MEPKKLDYETPTTRPPRRPLVAIVCAIVGAAVVLFRPRHDPIDLVFVLVGGAMGIGGGFAILIYVGKIADYRAKQKR